MKNWFAANRRLLGLLAVLLPLAGLLVFVALRAGPLAAVPVTVATVQSQALAPALFGIGTVEARYTHRIGPTFAGRVATVAVLPGDAVRAGQEVGEMDPIDLDAATTLFIGTIQGLVMQSLLAGEPERISREAPAVLALYLRGIRRHP